MAFCSCHSLLCESVIFGCLLWGRWQHELRGWPISYITSDIQVASVPEDPNVVRESVSLWFSRIWSVTRARFRQNSLWQCHPIIHRLSVIIVQMESWTAVFSCVQPFSWWVSVFVTAGVWRPSVIVGLEGVCVQGNLRNKWGRFISDLLLVQKR